MRSYTMWSHTPQRKREKKGEKTTKNENEKLLSGGWRVELEIIVIYTFFDTFYFTNNALTKTHF
jgi:hypothetical protein